MTTHVQIGNIGVMAFQWNGQKIEELPAWARNLGLQASGDGTLQVPGRRGTDGAFMGEWIVHGPDGATEIMSDTTFTALYHEARKQPDSKSPPPGDKH